ncbi:MAG: hypothetical protein UY63_C0012G0003 [Parcubacteria group bacterium GW2011_GWA2_51_10]|nr:MAG: hypothetical protein UY63_C0012G0003 [Parcubacteria group bacterium GW2011_GWA2_51_10]
MRLLLTCAGIASSLFAPAWVTLLFMGALALRYPAWEVLLIGILMDYLWMPDVLYSLPLFTITAFILVWGFEPLRKEFLLS